MYTYTQTWKKRTYTPAVGQNLNWPPHIRACFGSMLLFAVFPPKVRTKYRTNYIYKVGIISTYKKNNFIYIKTDISTCIQ